MAKPPLRYPPTRFTNTRVEVYVALALLGMVAALVVPRLKTQERHHDPLCLTRLLQLSSALEQYAQDYDDHLPPPERWQECIRPYLRSGGSLGCPDQPTDQGYALYAPKTAPSSSNEPLPLLYDSSKPGPNAVDTKPLESLMYRHSKQASPDILEANIAYSNGRSDTRQAPPAPK